MILLLKKIIEKYKIFIKYIFSSGLSFAIDLTLFSTFVFFLKPLLGDISILIATLCARIISSFFNYLMNRNSVFGTTSLSNRLDRKTLVKYYLLVIVQMCISSFLVFGVHKLTKINETIIKIPIDISIFIVNYFVQKLYIFKK